MERHNFLSFNIIQNNKFVIFVHFSSLHYNIMHIFCIFVPDFENKENIFDIICLTKQKKKNEHRNNWNLGRTCLERP